ncbi:MAG TPA: type II toxin-antitoxin system RelE/ParE family toxin [Acidimicrobiales bacterium]|nr:type II toxin-antitoxin system RelE/ParE family toxin [Acidimicrobiales bacterium]
MSGAPYQITWSPTARRDLTKLPEKVAIAAIEFLYGPVADDPHRTGAPLKLGLEGLHSARRGDHRILYAIDDDDHVVRVVTIEHRSDVYRRRAK